jgi:DNA-binding transcriptional regulator YdaS (Cro superfamily)
MEHLTTWFNEKRGRRSALAAYLNVYPGAVTQWHQVPAERVVDVEAFTGIKREKLRPDVFGKRVKAIA